MRVLALLLLLATSVQAQAAADLLATDRRFAAAAGSTDFVSALSAAFADDVVMPAPSIGFANGKRVVLGVLQNDTLNATSRASWHPIRAGVSADGTHGFTIGFIDVTRADGRVLGGKYLAYWIKGAEGWRIAVYRRVPRPAGAIDTTTIAALLPGTRATATLADTAASRASLAQAEADFSALASQIGLGPAFERFGDAEAMHVAGGPTVTGFVRGNVAIAASVGGGLAPAESPVTWAADHRTIVAPSGDFGVNIGYIHAKAPGPDGKPRAPFPFFTIWRRDGVNSPWRYIAE